MGGSDYWTRSRRLTRRATLSAAVAAGAGGALALAGCDDGDDKGGGAGRGGTGGAAPTPQAQAPQVDLNATLRVAITADTGNYDPVSFAGIGNNINITTHYTPPLAQDPATREIVGYMADYQWVDGNRALQLTARPGIKFHNGDPFDGEALKFTMERAFERGTDPATFSSGRKGLTRGVTDITLVDPMTVKLTFAPVSDIAFPLTLAGPWPIVSPGHWKKAGDQGYANEPAGTGPFKFVSRVRDSELRSVRNDAFFNPRDNKLGPRLPYAAALHTFIRPELGARVAALEAGEVDLAVEVSADTAKAFEARPNFQVFVISEARPLHVHFSTIQPTDTSGQPNPWRDIRVRKAAIMAVDLDTITKTILTGKETPAFGPPSNAPGFPRDIVQKRFKFDPKEAKALLAQAGYPNGFTTNYFFPPDSASIGNAADTAPAIAAYLADVGIKANLRSMPQAQFLEFARSKKESGMFHLAGTSGDVNVTFLSQYRSDGTIALSHDPALNLDPLIDRQAGEFDPAKRNALIAEITTKFYENASWLFLYEGAKIHLGRKNIEWARHSPTGTFPELWNIKVLKKA